MEAYDIGIVYYRHQNLPFCLACMYSTFELLAHIFTDIFTTLKASSAQCLTIRTTFTTS